MKTRLAQSRLLLGRRVYIILLNLAGLAALATGASAQLTQDSWVAGTGNWSNNLLWTAGIPNSNGVAALVDNGKPINSTIDVDGGYTVGALTIDSGDAVSIDDAETLTVTSSSGLSGAGVLTNNGTLTIASGGDNTTLSFTGTTQLTGTGTTVLQSADSITGSGTLTIGSEQTIEGYTGDSIGADALSIINEGTINANTNNQPLSLDPANAGSVVNSGTIEATNGGIIELSGYDAGTFTNNGSLEALAGSEIRLIYSPNVTGPLTSVGTGFIHDTSSATLTNATLTGTFVTDDSITTTIAGGTLVNNSTLTLTSEGDNTRLLFSGSTVLSGTGTIVLQAADSITGVGTLTIGSGQTIKGYTSGSVGGDAISIINQGTINANTNNQPLSLDPANAGSVVNSGTIEATNGGIIELSGYDAGTFTNNGSLEALAGSEIRLIYSPNVTGPLTSVGTGFIHDTSSATLTNATLTGTFVTDDSITTTIAGGTLVNNSTLTLTSEGDNTRLLFSGSTVLSGTGTIVLQAADSITGVGTLTIGSGQTIKGYTSGSVGGDALSIINQGTINANTNNQPLSLDPANAGSVVNSGTVEATNGGIIELSGYDAGTFTNNGSLEALAGSEIRLIYSPTVTGPLTSVGTGFIHDTSGATLTNATLTGTFRTDDSIRTTIAGGTLVNNSTLTLASGGDNTVLYFSGDTSLTGTGTLVLQAADNITGSGTLTIGSGQTIEGYTSGSVGGDALSIVNYGTINSNTSGQTITLDPASSGLLTNYGLIEAANSSSIHFSGYDNGSFTNQGTIAASPSSTVTIDSGYLTNFASNTLTSGVYRVTADTSGNLATLTLSGGSIATNAATVDLGGANSAFAEIGGLSDNRGGLALLAQRQFTTGGNLTDEGVIDLDAGSTLHVSGNLTCATTTTLAFTIGGTSSSGPQSPGVLQVNHTATVNGKLLFGFSPGAATPAATDTFILVSAGAPIAGAFTNAANGARVTTDDLRGSFLVNYGANSTGNPDEVVLTQFQAKTVTPGLPPKITSASTALAIDGGAFSYLITADESPTSYSVTGLPAGLTVDSVSGIIEGTPTVSGTLTLTISATNSAGTGSATLTVTVKPIAPVINSSTTANATEYFPFSYQITALNQPSSFSVQGLPAGLTVNDATGLISGTPTAKGTFHVALNAYNSAGKNQQPLTLTVVLDPPSITSSTTASATVGDAFSYQITATSMPTSYAAANLPAGLSINTGTGLISGTPTTAGSFTPTVSATNSAGKGTATVTITINKIAPVITSPTTATAFTGQAFSYQITVNNSAASYSVQGLPAGLTASNSTGLISGTPTAVGTYNVTLNAYNSAGKGSQTLTLTVKVPPPAITSATSASANLGAPFSYQITASNSPTSYAASGLPAGVTVNTGSGLISGTPSATGTFSVTLGATNGTGTGNATLTLTVTKVAPVITSPTSASGTEGTAFSYQITVINTAVSYSVQGLPKGLSANNSTGLISGTPTVSGSFSVTLNAYNSVGKGSQALSLTVAP